MSKNWKIIFSCLGGALLLLVLSILINKWAFPDTNWNLSREGERIKLMPDYPVKQNFEAAQNNLSQIRIAFSRSYNKDGGEIRLKLAKNDCEKIIAEKNILRSEIKAEGYYDFKFPAIANSLRENFCLLIEFDPEKEKYKDLSIFLSEKNEATFGAQLINSFQNEEIKNRTLSMRPAYQEETLGKNIEKMSQRISQYKPWFLKHFYLETIFWIFLGLTLAVVVFLVWF